MTVRRIPARATSRANRSSISPFDPAREQVICLGQLGLGQDDDDLVAAVARCEVGAPDRLPDGLAQRGERFVACLVSVGVIELLEIVHIDQRQRELPPVPGRPLEFPAQDVLEISPVEQPGQAVGNRQLFDLLMRPGMMDRDGSKGTEDLQRLQRCGGEFRAAKSSTYRIPTTSLQYMSGTQTRDLIPSCTATGLLKKALVRLAVDDGDGARFQNPVGQPAPPDFPFPVCNKIPGKTLMGVDAHGPGLGIVERNAACLGFRDLHRFFQAPWRGLCRDRAGKRHDRAVVMRSSTVIVHFEHCHESDLLLRKIH